MHSSTRTNYLAFPKYDYAFLCQIPRQSFDKRCSVLCPGRSNNPFRINEEIQDIFCTNSTVQGQCLYRDLNIAPMLLDREWTRQGTRICSAVLLRSKQSLDFIKKFNPTELHFTNRRRICAYTQFARRLCF